MQGPNSAAAAVGSIPSEDPDARNRRELMEFYGLRGTMGSLRLSFRLLKNLILSALAKRAPTPGLTAMLHRWRGVNVGKQVYIGPGVEIDFLYPELITIEDNVSIGMRTMIFAHSNPTSSVRLKERLYPRMTRPVCLKRGAWIPPGCIILPGVTIGEDAVLGAGSVVLKSVEPGTLWAGNPAKFIKKLELS